jgi:hypothetical protein
MNTPSGFESSPVENLENSKQKTFVEAVNNICYTFKMEPVTDYVVNGRTYEILNKADAIFAGGQSYKFIAENLLKNLVK